MELSFSIPSTCADQVEQGSIAIGLVPVVEVARQALEVVPGVGIACAGPVRSILLIARVPWKQVRTLAADVGSRTSVQLARIILRERFGVEPQVAPYAPALERMLAEADAALIIGDAALRLDTASLPYQVLDLGAEWRALTGLPMVFAVWAGKPGLPIDTLKELTVGSYEYGKARISEIAQAEHGPRQVSRELAEEYLRQRIHFELDREEQRGLEAFLTFANLESPSYSGAEEK